MSDEYLWDRSGAPDPDVERLEELLGALRHKPRRPLSERRMTWIAIAASLLITAAAGTWFFVTVRTAPTSWQLSLAGQRSSAVRIGQTIETGENTNGTLESQSVGTVDIDANSKVRVLAARENAQRLALDRGTIHAFIWAPPAQFVVDTPSARTVDLGCEYTLQVAKNGQGVLTVEIGWVAFQWRNLESFIPAGAACTTRPGHGPDTPHFLDAPKELIDAVARFDSSGDPRVLQSALQAARPRDGLTLWHLMQRTHGSERAEVFDRFAGLVPLPVAVTRDSILNGDATAMDMAWNALHLGNTDWWREWKRSW